MGLLQGRTLRDLLDRVFDWDAEQPKLLSYFLESAQAIAYAHAHGVIHRDITPSNIIAGDFGVVCVLDWGLAKILDRSDEVAGLFVENDTDDLFRDGSAEVTGDAGTSGTLHGSVLGTPSYISPEQARGELDLVDRRSDVFGLGGVLCEILTGQAPFVGDSPCEIYSKASRGDLSEAFERLESCRSPRFLVSLAKRCLAPNPADRPSDAGAVVRELIDFREAGQHRAEQDLIRFFDLTLDLLCIANLDGYFCRVNQNFTRLLGYSESELTSKRFLEFVHPEDREKTTEEMRRLSKGEPTIQFLNRYRHVDGRYLWLEWSARSVPIESAVYAVARDVTDRIQTTDPNRNRREENARVEQNGDGSKRPRSSRRQSR
jgi:serine/threonine-protein kinase